tara:strand:- start:857 stop:1468 length:612 start_codon:yes stop_codon:yes gene_type:complete
MGTLKTTNIQTITGSGTLTLGTSGETITIPSGVTATNFVAGVSSSSTSGTAISIDSSNRVSIPNQPFFYAKNTGTGSESGDGITTTPAIFPTTVKDVGSNLSNTNSRFTAPVDGLYFFTSVPGYMQTNINFGVRFLLNGSAITDPLRFSGSINSHSSLSFAVNLYLDANDYVELAMNGWGTFAYHRNNAGLANWWSGGLIYGT